MARTVSGAIPGQMLALHLRSLRPDGWGWTVAATLDTPVTRRLGLAAGPPSWLLWELDAERRKGTEIRGFVRDLAPFLGVMGVAPAEPGEHSTIPPRSATGGNIDCKELVAGSTLYLPVAVPDALLYLGDGHAVQGDGEIGGTAIECAMTTEVTVEVVTDPTSARGARGSAGGTGHLRVRHRPQRRDGTCVDLRITQVANQTWGVHAVLPAGSIG